MPQFLNFVLQELDSGHHFLRLCLQWSFPKMKYASYSLF
jgi:hypothetical protein